MNKPVYLGMSLMDISKIAMYEYWYDYAKPKNRGSAKICYSETELHSLCQIGRCFCGPCKKDFEQRFDTSNYKVERPLPIGENKKVISLIEYELGGKIMKVFVALRPNVYRYLSENECEAWFDLTFQRSVSFSNENNAKLILNIARYGWIGDKKILYFRPPTMALNRIFIFFFLIKKHVFILFQKAFILKNCVIVLCKKSFVV